MFKERDFGDYSPPTGDELVRQVLRIRGAAGSLEEACEESQKENEEHKRHDYNTVIKKIVLEPLSKLADKSVGFPGVPLLWSELYHGMNNLVATINGEIPSDSLEGVFYNKEARDSAAKISAGGSCLLNSVDHTLIKNHFRGPSYGLMGPVKLINAADFGHLEGFKEPIKIFADASQQLEKIIPGMLERETKDKEMAEKIAKLAQNVHGVWGPLSTLATIGVTGIIGVGCWLSDASPSPSATAVLCTATPVSVIGYKTFHWALWKAHGYFDERESKRTKGKDIEALRHLFIDEKLADRITGAKEEIARTATKMLRELQPVAAK